MGSENRGLTTLQNIPERPLCGDFSILDLSTWLDGELVNEMVRKDLSEEVHLRRS